MADLPEKKPAAPSPKSPLKSRLWLAAKILLLLAGLSGGALSGHAWWHLHGHQVKSWVKQHVPHKKGHYSAPRTQPAAPAPAPEATKPAEKAGPKFSLVAPDKGKKFDVLITSEFRPGSVARWETQAWKAGRDHKRVLVRITSPGGSGFAMLQFIQSMQDLKKTTGARLVCYGDIIVASAAAITLEAVCDERYVTPSTLILFHEAQIDGLPAHNEAQAEDEMAILHRLNAIVDQYIANRIGMPMEEYRRHVYGRDWWLNAEELMAVHGADGIVDPMDQPSGPAPEPGAADDQELASKRRR